MSHELTGDLAEWTVTLADGSVIRVWAHAYCEEASEIVFSMLMRGSPHYELDVVRLPSGAVRRVLTAGYEGSSGPQGDHQGQAPH